MSLAGLEAAAKAAFTMRDKRDLSMSPSTHMGARTSATSTGKT